MKKGLIFAGTTEGRLLAEEFARKQIPCVICVATEYGAQMLQETGVTAENKEQRLQKGRLDHTGLRICTGRLDALQMAALLAQVQPAVVIDATHPYAAEATENIKTACQASGYPYLRLLRAKSDQEKLQEGESGRILFFPDLDSAARYLEGQSGNLFLTTGSKELGRFVSRISDISRIYARILPSAENLQHCQALGLSGRQIICMQGPFSRQLNEAMLAHCRAAWLVTKDSGRPGGFLEKCQAAQNLGISSAVIQRPIEEQGIMMEQIWEKLAKYF